MVDIAVLYGLIDFSRMINEVGLRRYIHCSSILGATLVLAWLFVTNRLSLAEVK